MVEVILSLFSEKWAKKRHYSRKIQVTKMKMWDVEFLREKMRMMREGFRVEYDRIKEIVDAATIRLAAEKEKQDPDKTICTNLENLIKRHEPDMQQFIKQMEGIDAQIEGPLEGQTSLNDTIDGYRTVMGLLRDFKRKL